MCGNAVDEDQDGVVVPCALEDAAVAAWTGIAAGDWSGDVVVGVAGLGGEGVDFGVGAKGANGGAGEAYLVVDAGPQGLDQSLAAAAVRFATIEPCAALGGDLAALVGDGGVGQGLAIAAPNAYGDCAVGEGIGAVWVVTGDRSGVVNLDGALAEGDPGVVQYVGPGQGSRAGISVDGVGDLDGDGTEDLVVGSLQKDPEAYGGAWLLTGPFFGPDQRSLAFEAAARWPGRAAGDQAGCAVAGLGDFEGTGDGWIGIGACRGGEGGDAAGEVYFVEGATASGDVPLGSGDQIAVVGEVGDRFGIALFGGGDMDGDGRDEVVVGHNSCGYEFFVSGADCQDGRGRTGWSVLSSEGLIRGGVYRGEEIAAWRAEVGELQSEFSCNGAAAGRWVGDAEGVDLAFGLCVDEADLGAVVLAVDPVLSGQRVMLPDEVDAVVAIPGAEAGALVGAEIGVGLGVGGGEVLLVGAWKADGLAGADAGATYVVPAAGFAP